MQPSPKPGLDHGADVVQALLDSVFQPIETGIRAGMVAVAGFGSPGTVHTHGTVVTRP
jgi:hypothetical protein